MAESILNFDEGPMSPDIFSDQEKENTPDLPSTPNFDECKNSIITMNL